MLQHLKARSEGTYVLLRVVAGLMFAFHGLQKVFGVFAKFQPPFGTQLWVGGLIELVCGIAIALGLFTSWAAFIASGTMLVAYVQFHWKLAGSSQLIPTLNGGELAALYSVVFLAIAARGAGPISVDARRARRR